jgi:APA family basic amino acid/polyamine antiporter
MNSDGEQGGPDKRWHSFGLRSLTALVVANMIGAGVFTTSGFSLASLGGRQLVMWAWLAGGVIAIAGALSYGRLARLMTESGGEYLFLSRAMHPSVGFVAGWISLVAGFTGAIALAAKTLEIYVVPEALQPEWLPPGTLAIAAIVAFGLLHSLVKHPGIITQDVVVLVKVLVLIVFLGVAGVSFFTNPWSGWSAVDAAKPFSSLTFCSSLVWISLSYSGFNAAVYVAGEAASSERIVPRAMWLATAFVTLLYLGLNFVFLYAPPPAAIAGQEAVARIAAQEIGGPLFSGLVTFA